MFRNVLLLLMYANVWSWESILECTTSELAFWVSKQLFATCSVYEVTNRALNSLCMQSSIAFYLVLIKVADPGVTLYILVSLKALNNNVGPVPMEASQHAHWIGAFYRDLTTTLIPIQNLISVLISRRAGPLSEISRQYWRDVGRRDENLPIWIFHRVHQDDNVNVAHALLI